MKGKIFTPHPTLSLRERKRGSFKIRPPDEEGSPLELQDVQAGIPIADIQESIAGHIDVGGFRGERNVRPRIDQFFWPGRHPVSNLLWRECVLDIEHADAGIVVSCEYSLFAVKAAGPIFVQVMRTESAECAEIPFFW